MATEDDEDADVKAEKKEADALLASGVGIGVLGAAMAAVGGAVCPVCVVAAPALLGAGAFRRWRASRKKNGARRSSS